MAVSPELASATPILIVHIAGGGIALASGAAALILRKGGRLHGLAGKVFVAGMTVMGAFGAALGLLGPQKLAAAAGALAFYLVATAWGAVLRKQRGVGLPEVGGFLLAVGIIVTFVALGLVARAQPDGAFGEQPAVRYFVLAGIVSLPALLDLTVILRRGVAGVQRIARHLWRMCFALFIAATTFFPQQPDIFVGVPMTILIIPSLTVLAAMIYWLVRAPWIKRFRQKAAGSAEPA